VATAGGGVAIPTWMLDHTFRGDLGTISRQIAYLDAPGGANGIRGDAPRSQRHVVPRAPLIGGLVSSAATLGI
jgi:hypothetical protein